MGELIFLIIKWALVMILFLVLPAIYLVKVGIKLYKTAALEPKPTLSEEEKESIRLAYERLQKVAEMTRQFPIHGRYMQVIFEDEKRNKMFVNFEVHIGYDYDTPLLQRMKNMEKNMRAVELYHYFEGTPYEEGADYVTDIVFEQDRTIKFVTYSAMASHITRPQIINEFEALGIQDLRRDRNFSSFSIY